MTENTKPLTQAQRDHLQALNAAFMQAKQQMDTFVAYLRAEHDAPAGEWLLRSLQVGFEKIEKPTVPPASPQPSDQAAD